MLPRVLLLFLFTLAAHAHEHSDSGPTPEEANRPVDTILWLHMGLQALVWGVLFPIGMVLGLARSRWHVPMQATGFALTAAGYILGHSHGGRKFPSSFHGAFASWLYTPIVAQLCIGVYLKLHLPHPRVRPFAVVLHRFLGFSYPVLGWIQMTFGAMVFGGWCVPREGEMDKAAACLERVALGAGLIEYGILTFVVLEMNHQKAKEAWDGLLIFAWGALTAIVVAAKSGSDATIGLFFAFGGIAARISRRPILIGLVLALTGLALSVQEEDSERGEQMRHFFGYSLALAGLARILDIALPVTTTSSHIAIPHLTPLLLILSGFLYIGGLEDALASVENAKLQPGSYLFIIFTFSFALYWFLLTLVRIHATSGRNAPAQPAAPYAAVPTAPTASSTSRPYRMRRDEEIFELSERGRGVVLEGDEDESDDGDERRERELAARERDRARAGNR